MDKVNNKIINEYMLINEAFRKELDMYDEVDYYIYHQNNSDWYRKFGNDFNEILGFNGQTEQEFLNYMSTFVMTPEQKKSILEVRKHPMFKKLVGEASLVYKIELESLLGVSINPNGKTFADENGARVAYKTVEQLEKELNENSDKLSLLLSNGSITEEEYDRYDQQLDYIYSYYISLSKGEQLSFRKISDKQFEEIREDAVINGITFEEQVKLYTDNLLFEHEELQELQGSFRK